MTKVHKRLGDLLLEHGKVTPEQLEQALEHQRKTHQRLGHALVSLGYLTEDDLMVFLTEQFGVPAVKIDRKMLNPEVSRVLPFDLCMRYRVIPIMKTDDTLVVAAADPFNLDFIHEIKRVYPFKVELVLAPENAIIESIGFVFGRIDLSLEPHPAAETAAQDPSAVSASEELDAIVDKAIGLEAREVQILWKAGRLTVFFLGKVTTPEQRPFPAERYAELLKTLRLRAKMPMENREGFQEGLFVVKKEEKEHYFRVHIFAAPIGETVTIKVS